MWKRIFQVANRASGTLPTNRNEARSNNPLFRSRKVLALGAIAAICVITPYVTDELFENLDAKNIMVIQSPISGELTVYTDPGMKWQGFGKITVYPRRDQYSFSAAHDQGRAVDESIKTGFNDGGTGRVSGVMSWEMPLKPDAVIRLHKEYGSFKAIDQQLIRPMLEKVIFSSGATMSSIESSSERRPEIPQSIDDQLQNGPYLTNVSVSVVKDPITGQERPVRTVQVSTDKDGRPVRASVSTIKEYGISLSPVTIQDIVYEASVRSQIAKRQESTQGVQLSMAAATRAAQDAITTEKQGQAQAAKAKWDQEALKAKAVTEAEQHLEVASLAAKEAEQYKREQILRGEGEAERRRLVMSADGALDKKLEALVTINRLYAQAIEKAAPGAWSPNIVMGGNSSSSNGGTNAAALVELMTARTAKELGVDMNVVRNAVVPVPKK